MIMYWVMVARLSGCPSPLSQPQRSEIKYYVSPYVLLFLILPLPRSNIESKVANLLFFFFISLEGKEKAEIIVRVVVV